MPCVAGAERARLDRLAHAAGTHPNLFRHLAACITLQGGCNAEAARRLIEEERQALGDRTSTGSDDLATQLADALPLPGSNEIDGIRPDLIGEAFLWQHITGNRRKPEEQSPIIERAFRRAGIPVVTTLVHAAQDLAEGSAAHATVVWLDQVVNVSEDVSILIAIANELPQQTLALRELAVKITARIVEAFRSSTEADPALAYWLNNLSVRLSALGQREAALAAIQEAVDIRRALAAARPDAFRPDLAISLWVLADCLDENGDLPGGMAANAEAVAVLAVPFLQLPAAFAEQMAGMVQEYARRCETLGREPDRDPLAPILARLELF